MIQHRLTRVFVFMCVSFIMLSRLATASGDALFLGMAPPGPVPVPINPDIFSTVAIPHGSLTFGADNTEVYWSTFGPILYSLFNGQTLLAPASASFYSSETDGCPAFSIDGQRLFFKSRRPTSDEGAPTNAIWYVDWLNGGGWGEAAVVDSTIDDAMYQGQVSLAANGNLYFTGRWYSEPTPTIFRSRLVDSVYQRPDELEGPLTSVATTMLDPFVDPLERFILFSSIIPGEDIGAMDIYISFKQEGGTWGAPVNLGSTINMPDVMHRFPSMSRDGKYLFFVRSTGPQYPGESTLYYWVNASALPVLPCCWGNVGDADCDGGADPSVGDIATIIDNLFISGTSLCCPAEADVNQSGGADPTQIDITVSDISWIVDHLFITGTALAECP